MNDIQSISYALTYVTNNVTTYLFIKSKTIILCKCVYINIHACIHTLGKALVRILLRQKRNVLSDLTLSCVLRKLTEYFQTLNFS